MKFLNIYKLSLFLLTAAFISSCTSVTMKDFEGHWYSKTTQRRELQISNGRFKFFSGTQTVEGDVKLSGNWLYLIDPDQRRNDGGKLYVQEDGTLLLKDGKDWQLTMHKKE